MRDQRYEVLQKGLVKIRLSQGLTQAELANLLGRPQSFVSKYESGERGLDIIEFIDICKVLSIRPIDALKQLRLDTYK